MTVTPIYTSAFCFFQSLEQDLAASSMSTPEMVACHLQHPLPKLVHTKPMCRGGISSRGLEVEKQSTMCNQPSDVGEVLVFKEEGPKRVKKEA